MSSSTTTFIISRAAMCTFKLPLLQILFTLTLLSRIVPFVTGTWFASRSDGIAFQPKTIHHHPMSMFLLLNNEEEGFLPRGGDSTSNKIDRNDDEEDEEEEDEEEEEGEDVDVKDDEEEEEDEIVSSTPSKTSAKTATAKIDTTLATAALKSVTKTKEKLDQHKTAILKQTVQTQLSSTTAIHKSSKKKNKGSLLQSYKHVVPYILRAAMNPFTLFAMTKSYWASLFNLNYLQQVQQAANGSNVVLRTAHEEQEKRKVSLPASNNKRSKKTMKRGQAKTLNDLPKLSS